MRRFAQEDNLDIDEIIYQATYDWSRNQAQWKEAGKPWFTISSAYVGLSPVNQAEIRAEDIKIDDPVVASVFNLNTRFDAAYGECFGLLKNQFEKSIEEQVKTLEKIASGSTLTSSQAGNIKTLLIELKKIKEDISKPEFTPDLEFIIQQQKQAKERFDRDLKILRDKRDARLRQLQLQVREFIDLKDFTVNPNLSLNKEVQTQMFREAKDIQREIDLLESRKLGKEEQYDEEQAKLLVTDKGKSRQIAKTSYGAFWKVLPYHLRKMYVAQMLAHHLKEKAITGGDSKTRTRLRVKFYVPQDPYPYLKVAHEKRESGAPLKAKPFKNRYQEEKEGKPPRPMTVETPAVSIKKDSKGNPVKTNQASYEYDLFARFEEDPVTHTFYFQNEKNPDYKPLSFSATPAKYELEQIADEILRGALQEAIVETEEGRHLHERVKKERYIVEGDSFAPLRPGEDGYEDALHISEVPIKVRQLIQYQMRKEYKESHKELPGIGFDEEGNRQSLYQILKGGTEKINAVDLTTRSNKGFLYLDEDIQEPSNIKKKLIKTPDSPGGSFLDVDPNDDMMSFFQQHLDQKKTSSTDFFKQALDVKLADNRTYWINSDLQIFKTEEDLIAHFEAEKLKPRIYGEIQNLASKLFDAFEDRAATTEESHQEAIQEVSEDEIDSEKESNVLPFRRPSIDTSEPAELQLAAKLKK